MGPACRGPRTADMKPAIVGIAGPRLLPEEAALFRVHPPAGVILFARNIQDPPQLQLLMGALHEALPQGAVLMVDQEGGRVARLRPPHWRAHPPAARIGEVFAAHPSAGLRAAFLSGLLIGQDCRAAGFDVAAAPVLDLSIPGAHDVIGDRAFAASPCAIARLGRAMAHGLMAAGVQPVGKHAPGHGRARVDSHLALPHVDANDLDVDLLPFALNASLPWLMTAHIVYPQFDPIWPATLSQSLITGIIRGRMGFKGVLVTDDLAMKALQGTPIDLARQALAAGCDLALYCSGTFPETEALLRGLNPAGDTVRGRLRAARAAVAQRANALDGAMAADERDRLLA